MGSDSFSGATLRSASQRLVRAEKGPGATHRGRRWSAANSPVVSGEQDDYLGEIFNVFNAHSSFQ
jgi:hypothetical protein